MQNNQSFAKLRCSVIFITVHNELKHGKNCFQSLRYQSSYSCNQSSTHLVIQRFLKIDRDQIIRSVKVRNICFSIYTQNSRRTGPAFLQHKAKEKNSRATSTLEIDLNFSLSFKERKRVAHVSVIWTVEMPIFVQMQALAILNSKV